jgi:hypothetical protein
MTPMPIRKLIGSSMMPSVLESAKNKGSLCEFLLQRHTLPVTQSKDVTCPIIT